MIKINSNTSIKTLKIRRNRHLPLDKCGEFEGKIDDESSKVGRIGIVSGTVAKLNR